MKHREYSYDTLCDNVLIIPKVYLVPEAKPRDTNIPRVLLLLVNDPLNLLVPKAKPRNTNNITYYYFYSVNVPNHLLIFCRIFLFKTTTFLAAEAQA